MIIQTEVARSVYSLKAILLGKDRSLASINLAIPAYSGFVQKLATLKSGECCDLSKLGRACLANN